MLHKKQLKGMITKENITYFMRRDLESFLVPVGKSILKAMLWSEHPHTKLAIESSNEVWRAIGHFIFA